MSSSAKSVEPSPTELLEDAEAEGPLNRRVVRAARRYGCLVGNGTAAFPVHSLKELLVTFRGLAGNPEGLWKHDDSHDTVRLAQTPEAEGCLIAVGEERWYPGSQQAAACSSRLCSKEE